MKSSSEKSKPFIVATRHDLALAMSAIDGYKKWKHTPAMETLGWEIPLDWSGSIEVRGCIEAENEVRSRLESWEKPEFFSLYFTINGGGNQALIDCKYLNDAITLAMRLAPGNVFVAVDEGKETDDEFPTTVTIGIHGDEDELNILCTMNSYRAEQSGSQFEQLVRQTVKSYRAMGIKAVAYHREDCDNRIILEEDEREIAFNDVDTVDDLPPQVLDRKVAFVLADRQFALSGFTADQLQSAKDEADNLALLVWAIEDVYQQAEISEEAAQLVLRKINEDHDAGIGCNWETISNLIGMYAG